MTPEPALRTTFSPDRISRLRQAVATGTYSVDARRVAEAILHRLVHGPLAVDDIPAAPPEPRLGVASSQPTVEEVARSQLNRYAIDLKHSYERELRRSKELEERSVATVRALAAAVAERDDGTGNHLQRVHDLGLLLARAVVPEEANDPELAYGFILHDIGKIAIPDEVLHKPGSLDEEEWALMKTHAEVGARILDPVPFLSRAREVVLHHHERWDGRGYPHGLAGEEIPLWARIFAVVDAVDAMTNDRPYRARRPLEAALAELEDKAGTVFDPRCVSEFLALDRREVARSLQHSDENHLATLVA